MKHFPFIKSSCLCQVLGVASSWGGTHLSLQLSYSHYYSCPSWSLWPKISTSSALPPPAQPPVFKPIPLSLNPTSQQLLLSSRNPFISLFRPCLESWLTVASTHFSWPCSYFNASNCWPQVLELVCPRCLNSLNLELFNFHQTATVRFLVLFKTVSCFQFNVTLVFPL